MATVDGDDADIVTGFGLGSHLSHAPSGHALNGLSLDADCECPPFVPVPTPPPLVYVQTTGPRISGATSLGGGIIRPFRRTEHQDFANDSGVAEVLSCVGQVLGTEPGTQPWRVDFGCSLERLRHKNKTQDFVELARVFIADALKKWEPRAELHNVQASPNAKVNELGLEISVGIGSQIKTLKL